MATTQCLQPSCQRLATHLRRCQLAGIRRSTQCGVDNQLHAALSVWRSGLVEYLITCERKADEFLLMVCNKAELAHDETAQVVSTPSSRGQSPKSDQMPTVQWQKMFDASQQVVIALEKQLSVEHASLHSRQLQQRALDAAAAEQLQRQADLNNSMQLRCEHAECRAEKLQQKLTTMQHALQPAIGILNKKASSLQRHFAQAEELDAADQEPNAFALDLLQNIAAKTSPERSVSRLVDAVWQLHQRSCAQQAWVRWCSRWRADVRWDMPEMYGWCPR